jgi:hypothetical protein
MQKEVSLYYLAFFQLSLTSKCIKIVDLIVAIETDENEVKDTVTFGEWNKVLLINVLGTFLKNRFSTSCSL